MSQQPTSPSPDLQRLSDDGYAIQILQGLLITNDIPYLNSQRQVLRGRLISTLELAGDQTQRPKDHKAYFDGEPPCDAQGNELSKVINSKGHKNHGEGITSEMMFSQKPNGGYIDYYQKISTYVSMLSAPASVLDPSATAQTYRAPDPEEKSVFKYSDTASSRAGIGELTDLLRDEIVAIIGLGGTGSYILDLLAKTPVAEIRLFDSAVMLNHSAFRAPGAPSLEQLRGRPMKVDYYKSIYDNMRKGIVAHPVNIDGSSAHLLDGITSAFICVDFGDSRKCVVENLEILGVPFVDVGMGLELINGSLGGILRVTASTPSMRDHVRNGRAPLAGNEEENIYSSNIQVADLNSLNAALAVVKWKKICGFYRDAEREHHMSYTTDGNQLESCELLS